MPARTKGRAKFFLGDRLFVWWVDGERYLRIASIDKRFVVAVDLTGISKVLDVIGTEFPGIDPLEPRPVRLKVTLPSYPSLGAFVNGLLRWAFDSKHKLIRSDG